MVALPSHTPGRVQGQGLNRGFLDSRTLLGLLTAECLASAAQEREDLGLGRGLYGHLGKYKTEGQQEQMCEPAAPQEGKTSTLTQKRNGASCLSPSLVAGLGTGWLCQPSLGPTSHQRMLNGQSSLRAGKGMAG